MPPGRLHHGVRDVAFPGRVSEGRHADYEKRGPRRTFAMVTLVIFLCELRQPVGAVALRFLVDAEHVEHAQQKIARRHRLPVEGEMAVAFQPWPSAPPTKMCGTSKCLMLVRIPHVRPA